VSDWEDIFWINEPVARLVEQLRDTAIPCSSARIPIPPRDLLPSPVREDHRFVRPLILSYEVGHMKPSAEFYRACVAASGVPAASCVFIDDLIENVEGAGGLASERSSSTTHRR